MNIRVPELAGALNFRDMGGYATGEGRLVRWHKLYRSGTTHALLEADLAELGNRGIRYAYDLRSNHERREYPNRLASISNIHYSFQEHEEVPGDIRRLLGSAQVSVADSRRMMIGLYRQLPYTSLDAYRSLFAHLIAGSLPLVFNCAAGKDRTGVAAALILSALGVPFETILEDYLLTNQFFARSCEILLQGKAANVFASLDRQIWEPLMRVDAEYLQSTFDELNTAHGSVEQYLSTRLGVGKVELKQLRSHLLE
jgi:protein-tyrosine phosphatase